MRIVLFRHGIAIDREDPACPPEEERFLTDVGIARTTAAARGLARLGVQPDRILSSPWLRARQTADLAARELGFDPERIELTDALLPFAPPGAVLEQLSLPPAVDILLTGHAPHLDEVLRTLVGASACPLKKAGAAAIGSTSLAPGQGRLEWLVPPRALRGLGAG